MSNCSEVPFVHLFETYKGKYIFDINSNAIFKVPGYVYNDLKKYLQTGKITYGNEKSQAIIEKLINNGLLSSHRWQRIEHPGIPLIPYYLNTSVSTITLQVTQACNLQCRYCPYAGSFYNRKHSPKKMKFEVGKAAIDFYVRHSVDEECLNIGFYGGEPLIEFELIKKLVEYVSSNYKGKKVQYHMTSNATLLKDEMIPFLEQNSFNLLVSLDGPKEIHDKNRIQQNNKGSFELIMENLKRVHKNYPDFARKIRFNCVIDPSSNFDCIHEFFTNYPEVRDYYTSFSYISKQNIIEDTFKPTEEYTARYRYEVFKLFLFLMKRISEEHVSKIVKSYYNFLFTTVKDRRTISFAHTDYGHHSGPCITGNHKIFVDTEGNFFPCEKVNENSDSFKIGSIYDGFDYERAIYLTNIGKLTEAQCLSCWNVNFCSLCCLFAENNGEISAKAKLSNCNGTKCDTEELFKDFCFLEEVDFYGDEQVFKLM